MLIFVMIFLSPRHNGNATPFSKKTMQLIEVQIKEVVDRALAEDLGWGDVTTEALMSSDQQSIASIMAKEQGILAGIGVAKKVFHRVDPKLKIDALLEDGAKVGSGSIITRIEGKVSSILKAERVALNFLQRLSGIASETNRYVEAVKGLPVRIIDTRKTTPGLRLLEKYAVRVGGGENHRMNLGDGILIKDNHLAALRSHGLNLKEIITRIRQNTSLRLKVEVETRTVQEALEAAEAGADIVMLDNMNLKYMRRAVKLIHGAALIEASGRISLDKVRSVAETGVDFISVGALTHSVRALDVSLKLE